MARLLALLGAVAAVAAQPAAPSALALGSLTSFSPLQAAALPSPAAFALPAAANVSVSVALCAPAPAAAVAPSFSVSNASDGSGAAAIPLTDGFGSYSGPLQPGAVLTVAGVAGLAFEVAVSDTGPVHALLSDLPLLGDTTNDQALLFTPPFAPDPPALPTFPNYTLPPADLPQPPPPPDTPSPANFSLVFAPTTPSAASNSTDLRTLPQTGCALLAAPSAGSLTNTSVWQRDPAEGWRVEFIVQGLDPLTNYTAYVVQDGTRVSGPINLVTKSTAFSCPLLHALPFCPSTAYAAPLPPPPAPLTVHDASTLPSAVSAPLLDVLGNFSIALLSTACGRDLYSPIVSCTDCLAAYRRWLCATQLPRCSEPAPSTTSTSTPTSSAGLIASFFGPSPAQTPLSALLPVASPNTSTPSNATFLPSDRNPSLPAFPSAYTALLPCIETCTAADRACPVFLGFACPAAPAFGANYSYGFGFVDSAVGGVNGVDGSTGGGVVEGKGLTGVAQDRWGNVWCNGV